MGSCVSEYPPRSTALLSRQMVLPKIAHWANVGPALKTVRGRRSEPISSPLCGELMVTYTFDDADLKIPVTAYLLELAAIDGANLHALAMGNLGRSDRLAWAVLDQWPLYSVVSMKVDPSTLLVDRFWDRLEGNLAGPAVVSLPGEDLILVCDGHDPHAVAILRRETDAYFRWYGQRAGSSAQLMIRDAGRWTLFEQ